MTIENYIVIAIGIFAIVGGVLIFRGRRRIYNLLANLQKDLIGERGDSLSKRASAYWVGFTGIVSIAIGVVAILTGVFARE
ncbi:hypothetical protein [Microbacterium sp. LWH13-1.2]|uniref:hypothetical protein n=1 Tax=Microbacterium sp. LWH13-1.2 TaxID=3135260 RepID=UPI0031390A5A